MAGQNLINNISILSYNSTGWNNFKGDFINTILLSHSMHICAIQEHFLLDTNLYTLQKCFPQFDIFGIPAFKSNAQINVGRPSGGLAFVYSRTISKFVKHIECPNSRRVQGLLLTLPTQSYLFINCYFPVDARNNDVDELIKILQDIKFLMDTCTDNCKIVILGDLNADFSRNTTFVTHLKTFLHENNLDSLWTKFDCDFTQCQSRTINGRENTYFSVIDHFCVDKTFFQDCKEAMPLHLIDNTSNHEPIFLKLNCVHEEAVNVSNKNSTIQPKPCWGKATDDNIQCYVNDLGQGLSSVELPNDCVHCSNLTCIDPAHRDQIDNYAFNVVGAISDAVNNNIPFTSENSKKSAPFPGWSQYIRPFREDALFWYSVWSSAGKPLNCQLHNVMKSTRNKYHYVIRKIRKRDKLIRKQNLIEDCLHGNVNNIFKKIKAVRKNESSSSNSMDGVFGKDNIADLFRNKYETIYNKHSDDFSEVCNYLDIINDQISNADFSLVSKINNTLITQVVNELHSGKGDVVYDWGSDALKHGVQLLAPHLTNIFRSFLVHGHISELFNICALRPIVKNKNSSKSNSDNYRLIAISSIILKMLDKVILHIFGDNFISPNLQFGFHKYLSTTMCTWTLLETINYFTNRNTSVYVCLLDLSKAFDHVQHSKLFKKLSSKVPPLFLRLIIVSYLSQNCSVKWDDVYSSHFDVTNGVRQGAVASPYYFNAYTDELFTILKESGLGCYIDIFFFGLLGYADDFSLISPTRAGLQSMLQIAEAFFKKHGIDISVNIVPEKSKTKCLAFNVKKNIPARLSLYNYQLPWVKDYKHLGHFIHTDESMSHDILQKRGQFISKVHALRQELGKQHPEVFMYLVQVYLGSMYGSNIWDLFSPASRRLYTAWNILIRTTFDLPYATHRYILYNITNSPHIRISIMKRFIKFYSRLAVCNKPEIRLLFNLQKFDCRSIFGRNCFNICKEFNAMSPDEVDLNKISMPIKIPDGETWRIPFIDDLLNLRGSDSDIPQDDINSILNLLCVQ